MAHPEFAVWPVCGQPVKTGLGLHHDPARTRTALQECAYLRRTRFTNRSGGYFADYTLRSADLEAIRQFVPATAPWWARSPFLRWSRADEAAEKDQPGSVRAWLVVGMLPRCLSAGQSLDGATALVEEVLARTGALADMAIHLTPEGLRHAHLLVASRDVSGQKFGDLAPDRHALLNHTLRNAWCKWRREGLG